MAANIVSEFYGMVFLVSPTKISVQINAEAFGHLASFTMLSELRHG